MKGSGMKGTQLYQDSTQLMVHSDNGTNPDLLWMQTANPRMISLQVHPHDGWCPQSYLII